MRDDERVPLTTRRTALTTAATVLAGTALAGCSTETGPDAATETDGDGDGSGVGGEGSGDGDGSGASGGSSADDDTGTSTDDAGDANGYTATLSPAGEVRFESVPERVFTVFPEYADMALAFGHAEKLTGLYVPEMAGTTLNQYCHHLEGVSLDWDGLYDPLADGLSKEKLYALDSDVHLADPVWAAQQQGWDESDVEEIRDNVGPWFGNYFSGTKAAQATELADGEYEFYTLWELAERVAQVFREEARFEALQAVHADLLDTIQSQLPPEDERPSAVRVSIASDGASFYTYHLNRPGFWLADTRPLGAVDAFADRDWENLWGQVDFETMAEADPDVILHLWGFTPSRSMADMRAALEDHPVGRQLTAVQNDRVYAAGMRYQGPIMNLFQLEMGAKQLYPDVFGEWPTYQDGDPYPNIPADEQLFDRDRVAAIINGDAEP